MEFGYRGEFRTQRKSIYRPGKQGGWVLNIGTGHTKYRLTPFYISALKICQILLKSPKKVHFSQ